MTLIEEALATGNLFLELSPIYQTCNRAHDERHIKRVLKLREKYWPTLIAEKATMDMDPFVLDLAILFHELNRAKQFRGKDEITKQTRAQFIVSHLSHLKLGNNVINDIILATETSSQPRSNLDSPLRTLLSDLDCCDIGAVGILRMADVAADRGYGYGKARNFNPTLPATEGDENLDSVTDDLKFCLEWWNGPYKFRIINTTIRKLAEYRFQFMRDFLIQLKNEFEEIKTL